MSGNEKVLPNDVKHPFSYSEDIGSFFASDHRHISADSKVKNCNIIFSFVSYEGLKAQTNKTFISFMFLNCHLMRYDGEISVWHRTGSNKADINLIRSLS